MSERRDAFLKLVEAERLRNSSLPGSEYDLRKDPSDWAVLAGHYLFEEARRGHIVPEADAFAESLVKAAAVIVAAYEHIEVMQNRDALL